MPDEQRVTLIEYLYQDKPNGKLFVDSLNGRNYQVEEIYGTLLNLGSTLLLMRYEDGKSKFAALDSHQDDLEFIAETTALQLAG